MELPATHVTNFFGFDQLLPTGRQNTFHNMITLIQSQLERLVNTDIGASDKEIHTGTLIEQHAQPCSALLSTTESGIISFIHINLTIRLHLIKIILYIDNTHNIQALSTTATPSVEEVALLISGGVDSSVALKLLLDQGHKVRAYYLKIWLEDELAHMNACPWDEDIRYAQSGKIPIHRVLISYYIVKCTEFVN